MINLNNSTELYPIFYKSAFILGIVILILEGYRRKLRLTSWFILIASTIVFAILGTRFGTYGLEDWRLFLADGHLSQFGHKSSLGGIVFGITGFFLVKKAIGLKTNVTDAFAFFLPVVMLFQRAGCLSAGCCFGLPYDGIGSLQYSGFSFIRDYQLSNSWIPFNQLNTIHVHAVPVYLMLVSIFTIAILIWVRKKFKQPGSLFLLSMLCMGIGRFVVEFFRDPVTNHSMGDFYFGLKFVQWFILVSIVLGTFLFWWIEFKTQQKVVLSEKPSLQREILTLLGLCVFIFNTKDFFTAPELLVILFVLGIAIIEIFRQLFNYSIKPEFKIVPYVLIFSSIFLMGQTYHYRDLNDTGITQTIITGNLMYKNMLETQYPCLETAQGCGGTYCALADTASPMGPDYLAYNFGIDKYKKTNKKFDLNYGVNAQVEQYVNTEQNHTAYRFNAYPYFGLDGKKYFGFRFGIRLGDMFNNQPEVGSSTNILPAGRFWFGHKDYATLQVGIFDSDLAGPYNAILDIRTNYNFTKISENKLGQISLGAALSNSFPSYYMLGEVYMKPNLALIPRFGLTVNNLSTSGHWAGFSGGLGIRYNMPSSK
jgi:prolipoprotein diacylglyceryltransferase